MSFIHWYTQYISQLLCFHNRAWPWSRMIGVRHHFNVHRDRPEDFINGAMWYFVARSEYSISGHYQCSECSPPMLCEYSLPMLCQCSLPMLNEYSLSMLHEYSLPMLCQCSLPIHCECSLPMICQYSLPILWVVTSNSLLNIWLKNQNTGTKPDGWPQKHFAPINFSFFISYNMKMRWLQNRQV